MFALCHCKNDELKFVLFDKDDIKEIVQQMDIEVEQEFGFEEFDKNYSFYPLMSLQDLLLRTINKKARTITHVLDELGISCWMKIKQEYTKIQEKTSSLSRSHREMLEQQHTLVLSM